MLRVIHPPEPDLVEHEQHSAVHQRQASEKQLRASQLRQAGEVLDNRVGDVTQP
jgi:hypothetical protein